MYQNNGTGDCYDDGLTKALIGAIVLFAGPSGVIGLFFRDAVMGAIALIEIASIH
jgi:hypothetical protein